MVFLPEGWDDYLYWQREDKRTLHKINQLLTDISRNANEGLGKPEPLGENLTGWWSRRIDDKNRLVYRVLENANIEVAQCKGHYNGK
jgi:toxin YoeB